MFAAFWFHRVESIDFCISLSTVSPSEEEVFFNKAYWLALPLSNSWRLPKKTFAIRLYMKLLLQELQLESSSEFVRTQFLENRYKFFISLLKPHSDLYSELEVLKCYDLTFPSNNPYLIEMTEKFQNVIKKQVASLNQIASKDILRIVLANYFEELAAWAVDSKNIIAFFSLCF